MAIEEIRSTVEGKMEQSISAFKKQPFQNSDRARQSGDARRRSGRVLRLYVAIEPGCESVFARFPNRGHTALGKRHGLQN